MLPHTTQFKEKIVELGKEQDVQITYGSTTIDSEDLLMVKPNFNGNMLKAIMQGIDIKSYVEIPIGTIINVKWGLKVNDNFEYLEFNNFEVYSCDKEENSNSYYIVAYDKMLQAKKDYEELNLTYPVTLKQFIVALANSMGLSFNQEDFVNASREIPRDKFKDIGYTKMDVLDDIAEATASTIVVKNGELKLLYVESPVNQNDIEIFDEEYIRTTTAEFKPFGPINSVVFNRSTSDNIYRKDDTSISANGLCEILIRDNQLLNDNDRENYIDGVFNQLKGLSWTICDFTAPGIGYLEPLDVFGVKVRNNVYTIIMFSRTLTIEDGSNENIFVNEPDSSQTDYKKANQTENQTTLIVNKQTKEIQATIEQVNEAVAVVDDIATDYVTATEYTAYKTEQTQKVNKITSDVERTTTTLYGENDDDTGLVSKVNTQGTRIEQTESGITALVSTTDTLNTRTGTLEENTQDVVNQLKFDNNGLTISNKGSTTQDMKLNLTNDQLRFLYLNRAVLTINGNKIEFTNGSFEKLDLGRYVWLADAGDTLSLLYEED